MVTLFGLPFATIVNADFGRVIVALFTELCLLPKLFVLFVERIVDPLPPLSPISANNIVTVSNPRTLSCLAKVGLRAGLFFVDSLCPLRAEEEVPPRLNPTPRAETPRFVGNSVPPDIDCRWLLAWFADAAAAAAIAALRFGPPKDGVVVLAGVVPIRLLLKNIEGALETPTQAGPWVGDEGKCMTLPLRVLAVPNREYRAVFGRVGEWREGVRRGYDRVGEWRVEEGILRVGRITFLHDHHHMLPL